MEKLLAGDFQHTIYVSFPRESPGASEDDPFGGPENLMNLLTKEEIKDGVEIRFETKIVRRIEEIPASDWESAYPQVLEGYRFFKALDDSNLQQFSLYYILVYQEGRPAGAACCFLMDYSLDTTVQRPLRTFAIFLKKYFPSIFNFKVLMCGSPTGPGRLGIIGEPIGTFGAIYKALEDIAEKEKVAIIAFKEFDTSYREALTSLTQKGFHRFDGFPNTKQEVHYENFDSYLKSLSYATRYDLKRKFRKVDGQVPIDLEITGRLGSALEESYDLYRQMLLKHETIFEVLSKEFFVRISEEMPGETKFFLWRIHGKLVAFAFCLTSKDYLLDCHIGLDYSVAYQYHLYFVRFRDIMDWSLKNGIHTYEMGNTNYDPKKRLGFRLIPQDIYAKHRNRYINPLLKIFCHFLEPKHSDPFLKELSKPKDQPKKSLSWGVFFMIILSSAVNGVAQVLMKKGLPVGVDIFSVGGLGHFLSRSASLELVWVGIILYASNFFLWVLVLSRIDLVVAIVLASTSYLILPILSIAFLHEKVSLVRWAGIALIMLGVYFVSQSSEEIKK